MKLYYGLTSPYVRKVMVVLHETGQLSDVELIPASGSPINAAEGLPAANPLGKIPALARPDGATLYDSRVICRYLDARAKAGLYPTGNSEWDILTLEATGDGMADAALLMVYEDRLRPEDLRFSDWVEGQWAKVDHALDALTARWMSHLHGPLNAGQISVACALAYLDFRHDARHWRDGHDALAAWYSEFAARDSMRLTDPAG